jgi:6-pyruvoyltetrahydropterin/6-carboxytetrahydropterin synthase
MHTVAVRRDFIAQHFLIGGDWGDENSLHSHHYVLELQLRGERLDNHGYLVDIVDIERELDAVVASYRDVVLNETPAFEGLNPSIEHFSRIVARTLASRITASNLRSLCVQIWENDIAWASFELVLR